MKLLLLHDEVTFNDRFVMELVCSRTCFSCYPHHINYSTAVRMVAHCRKMFNRKNVFRQTRRIKLECVEKVVKTVR